MIIKSLSRILIGVRRSDLKRWEMFENITTVEMGPQTVLSSLMKPKLNVLSFSRRDERKYLTERLNENRSKSEKK